LIRYFTWREVDRRIRELCNSAIDQNQLKGSALPSPRSWCDNESRMKPKRTILCVDDNEQSLSIRKVMLETRGYRVVCCTTAEEALGVFKNGGIDLVLSDVLMPGMDGTELISRIKSIAPTVPTILFSGKIKVYEKD